MNPITIGFLTPYSSIYPNFFPHIANGFYLGLAQKPGKKADIEILPEFAGTGHISGFTDGAKKLVQFSNADILSGMVSYRAIPDLTPLIDDTQKPAFFFDLGELLPKNEHKSPYIFANSHQLYQSEYALGYWAQKEYQQPGLILMPVYNSGYHLHQAFQFGVKDAGGNQVLQSVIHYKPNDPHHLDIDYALDLIRKEQPAFVHAIFIGPQGNNFLAKWKSCSWTKEVPLLVSENMLYEDMLADVWNLNLELYGAMLWNPKAENKANKVFTRKYRAYTGQPPNLYGLLGYESGLLFKEMLSPLKKRKWDVVLQKLRSLEIQSPRGIKNFNLFNKTNSIPVDIVKVKTESKGQQSFVVDVGQNLSIDNPLVQNLEQTLDSGWVNPYLCI